jgi:hypothetical protein
MIEFERREVGQGGRGGRAVKEGRGGRGGRANDDNTLHAYARRYNKTNVTILFYLTNVSLVLEYNQNTQPTLLLAARRVPLLPDSPRRQTQSRLHTCFLLRGAVSNSRRFGRPNPIFGGEGEKVRAAVNMFRAFYISARSKAPAGAFSRSHRALFRVGAARPRRDAHPWRPPKNKICGVLSTGTSSVGVVFHRRW